MIQSVFTKLCIFQTKNLLHFPVNIPFGKSSIPVHFICETLAYFIGYRYYVYLRKHTTDAISSDNRLIIFIGAAGGAFLGSHLVGIFENPALNFSKNCADGDDLLGDAYEYLMRHFATESGKSKGQFYTPAEVSKIMEQWF